MGEVRKKTSDVSGLVINFVFNKKSEKIKKNPSITWYFLA